MIREVKSEVDNSGKTNSFWEEETIICELEKSKKSFYRFSLCKKEGKEYVSVREFILNKAEDSIPTKKGMTINRENLGEFIECLEKINSSNN